MKIWSLALVAVTVLWAASKPATAATTLLTGEATEVRVVDLQARNDTVSGVVTNQSGHSVRDVMVLIQDTWYWNNERHPGEHSPGSSEFYTLHGDIAANGTLPFSYHRKNPLPERTDGHFTTTAHVVGYTEIGE